MKKLALSLTQLLPIALAVGCAVFMPSLDVQAQEPVTRPWLDAMWGNENTRRFIAPAIESNGVAFLPTRAVRGELERSHVSTDIIGLLTQPRYLAQNLTFMVCQFTCDNCGSSSEETTSFNQLVFDKTFYLKQLENAHLDDQLHGKTLHQSLGPPDGPPQNFNAVIVVFVNGHLHKENGAFRIVARLWYRDQGSSAKQLDSTDFVSANNRRNMKVAATSIADWSISRLREQIR